MEADLTVPVLVVAARNRHCALRMADVVETMRLLPVTPLPDMPRFMQGLSVIRGALTPVLDLGGLIGSTDETVAARLVTVRAGSQSVALAVDSIIGARWLRPQFFEQLPPLLRDSQDGVIEALGALHQHLLILLRTGRLLTDEIQSRLSTIVIPTAGETVAAAPAEYFGRA